MRILIKNKKKEVNEMTKLNENKKIVLELFLIFDEGWKNEDELVELGEKHGYKLKKFMN